jgi:transcriptional antiterminator RfaH
MENMSGPLRWHLVLTKPAGEECAALHLERQGYGVYFPRLQQKALRRGKWFDRTSALFPRYLFVHLDSVTQSLAPVRSTVGVANVVRFGADYMVVPDRVIETLQRNADLQTGLHSLRASDWFKRGDLVRVAVGSLSGLEGIFVSEDGNQRVTVLLNLLGRETHIQLNAGCVIRSAA